MERTSEENRTPGDRSRLSAVGTRRQPGEIPELAAEMRLIVIAGRERDLGQVPRRSHVAESGIEPAQPQVVGRGCANEVEKYPPQILVGVDVLILLQGLEFFSTSKAAASASAFSFRASLRSSVRIRLIVLSEAALSHPGRVATADIRPAGRPHAAGNPPPPPL
jgi:hypothetical protein